MRKTLRPSNILSVGMVDDDERVESTVDAETYFCAAEDRRASNAKLGRVHSLPIF